MSKIIDTIVELAVGYFNNYRGKFNLLKKKIMTFDRTPPPLPIFFRKYKVSVCQLATGMYYVVSPIKKATKNVVLYLHGGAFIFPITKYHYEFLDRIIGETNATFYIALYPISHPNYSSFDDTYTFLNELFLKIKDRHAKDTVNIMGDSSGACLVLSFAQYVKIHYKYKFTNVIAISPCPRFDYGQDEMISYSKLDPILNDGLLTGAYL
jgi:acetyl esterase/lipase